MCREEAGPQGRGAVVEPRRASLTRHVGGLYPPSSSLTAIALSVGCFHGVKVKETETQMDHMTCTRSAGQNRDTGCCLQHLFTLCCS